MNTIRTEKPSLFVRIRLLLGRLLRRRGIFYINGPDVLPAPLSEEEEAACLADPCNEESKSRLIEHNLRLVVYIAKRYESTGCDIEDLISIGTVGLIKAINTFRTDKNIKLATYASRCIENEILMHIRKTGSKRQTVSIDEPLNVDWDGNELLLSDILGSEEDTVTYELEMREERRVVRDAVAALSPRERELIELRYGIKNGHEMTQKEVADLLGISQSYISRLEKRILVHLKEEIAGKI